MWPRTIGWARAIHRSCIATMSTARATCLNAARRAGVQRIVYTSSVATIGIPADGAPGDERTPVALDDMIGHYKRSKYLAEEVVREIDAKRSGGRSNSVVIVNPSTPVGPGDVKPTPTGQLVLDAAAGRMPAYVDTGLNIVHVDDVAAGHLLAYERGAAGERYILGGEDMTLREILEADRATWSAASRRACACRMAWCCRSRTWRKAIARLTGSSGRITLEGVRMSRKRMFFSSAKAVRELGYRWRPPVAGVRRCHSLVSRHGCCVRLR